MADTGNFWSRPLIRRLVTVLVAGCLVAATASVPASAQPDPDLAGIDAYIEKEMREVHIPGLALGIVHNDELVHLRGFGTAGEGRPVTPQYAVHPGLGVQVVHRVGGDAAGRVGPGRSRRAGAALSA